MRDDLRGLIYYLQEEFPTLGNLKWNQNKEKLFIFYTLIVKLNGVTQFSN